MANTSSANGRTQRRSLAEQIDRLDAILDGLAEGINDTVVAAVQGAVQAAVRTAVAEVLTNEELRRRLQPVTATAPGPSRGLVGRLLGQARAFLGGLLRRVAGGCAGAAAALRNAWARGAEALGAGPGAERTHAAAACGRVASAARRVWAGVLAYLSGPWAAAAAGWLSGFVTTLAVQAGVALRKVLGAPASSA